MVHTFNSLFLLLHTIKFHGTSPSHGLADQMHDSLISSLSLLGVLQPLALRLAHHAGAAGMPLDGALARVSQLQFGVQNSIVSLHDATTMLSEQPECLRRDIRASLVTEAVVCVSKPYDMQMSLDKAGPRWPGEISVRDWLAAEHPETLTEDGEARLCRTSPRNKMRTSSALN